MLHNLCELLKITVHFYYIFFDKCFFFNLKMMALINFANKILSDMAGAAFFHYSGIDVEHILVVLLI